MQLSLTQSILAIVGTVEELASTPHALTLVRSQLETNFFGPVNMIRASLPTMREHRCGHIMVLTGISTFFSHIEPQKLRRFTFMETLFRNMITSWCYMFNIASSPTFYAFPTNLICSKPSRDSWSWNLLRFGLGLGRICRRRFIYQFCLFLTWLSLLHHPKTSCMFCQSPCLMPGGASYNHKPIQFTRISIVYHYKAPNIAKEYITSVPKTSHLEQDVFIEERQIPQIRVTFYLTTVAFCL